MIQIPRHSPVELSSEQLISCRQIRLHFPPWKNTSQLRQGLRMSRVRGRGMEFDEVRQYQAGDDVRNIDWRVTARTGKTHTKLFREDREHPVFIYLDLSLSMIFGSQDKLKSVFASEAAAALGWLAQSLGERVALLINLGAEQVLVKPSASSSQWLAQLQQIVEQHNQQVAQFKLQALNSSPYQSALHKLLHLVKTGYQVHLLSDFYQLRSEDRPLLQRLAQHNQVFAWQVVDPLEQNLPEQALQQSLEVSRLGKQGFIRLGHRSFQDKYQAKAEKRQQSIGKFFDSLAVPLQCFSTDLDWADYAG